MSHGYSHLGKLTICCVKMVFSKNPAKMFGAVGTLCPLREVAADKLQVLQSSCLQHFNISLYTTFHFVFNLSASYHLNPCLQHFTQVGCS